jgi:hypothetical protein
VLAALDAQLDELLRPVDERAWGCLSQERRTEIEGFVAGAHARSEEVHRLSHLSLRDRFQVIRELELANELKVDLKGQREHELVTAVRNDIAHGRAVRRGADVIEALELAEQILDAVQNALSKRVASETGRARDRGRAPTRPGHLAHRITHAFMESELDLGRPGAPSPGWAGMPEVVAGERMLKEGSSERQLRLFLTLTAALDRARESDRLWTAAASLFSREPQAFDPDSIVQRESETRALLKAFDVTQRHGADGDAWVRIAQTLLDPAEAPRIRTAIDEGQGDARELLREVVRVGPEGSLFPLLRGPKIAPVWVRILAYPGRARISRIATLPVGVDVQVVRITRVLGLTELHGPVTPQMRSMIQSLWAADVEAGGAEGPPGLEDTCAALDPALWFYSKWGCSFCERAGVKMPIGEPCSSCRLPSP